MDARRLPIGVIRTLRRLVDAGYAAYIVGGSVRDMLLGKQPSDFDVATDARPWEVESLFEQVVPVGVAFGTVLVIEGGVDAHVTTFRSDLPYVDGRRPSGVVFGSTIEEDLSRRDFTINAMAWNPFDGELVDPYAGEQDLRARLIRAVGDHAARFKEDALRTLRAVRFAAQLDFDIEAETWAGIEVSAADARRLSGERIRDELMKILAAPDVGRALWMMVELGLFFEVFDVLKGADRLAQSKRGAPTLLDHSVQAAAHVPAKPSLRLAALLHDVGKLHTRAVLPGGRVVYHGHPEAGAELTRAFLNRLRFSKAERERVATLVEMHMAVRGDVSIKAVRRWLGRHGEEWVRDLVALARADARASGWSEQPPEASKVEAMLEQALAEGSAFGVRDLAIDGNDVMEALGIGPGPAVGAALDRALEAVLDDPTANDRDRLLSLVRAMGPDPRQGNGGPKPKRL